MKYLTHRTARAVALMILTLSAILEAEFPLDRDAGHKHSLTSFDNRRLTSNDFRNAFLVNPYISGYAPAIYDQSAPSISFDGTNYLVIWNDERPKYYPWNIYGARLDKSGSLIDTLAIPIANDSCLQYANQKSSAFDGMNHLVVWAEMVDSDIYGKRISQSGTIIDTIPICISDAPESQYNPAVAFDGINYFVVWEDCRIEYTDLFGARITTNGQVLDTAGIPIVTGNAGQWSPSIAFDGTNYLVVWQDSRSLHLEIYAARIDQDGVVLDPSGFAVCSTGQYQDHPHVCFGYNNYFVVWENGASSNSKIYGTRIAPSGHVLDTNGIPISADLYYQNRPNVSFDSTNFYVSWRDHHLARIAGARIDTSGEVLDSGGITVSYLRGTAGTFPAIAFADTNYLVVWEDPDPAWQFGFNIYGMRVGKSASALDPYPSLISAAANRQEKPAIAFNGNSYLVVWQDNKGSSWDILGARIDSFGAILDTIPVSIATGPADELAPDICFDGTNSLVVWQDDTFRPNRINAKRISSSGTILDSANIVVSSDNWKFTPAIAFDGTNYLVVWRTISEICGARVDQAGNVIDTSEIIISSEVWSPEYVAISFDGTNYLVVWNELSAPEDEIDGARVSQAGTVLDTSKIRISTSADSYQSMPAVAFDGTNYLVIWVDIRGTNIYGSRVDPNGIPLDSAGIPLISRPGAQSFPSIIFDGQDYNILSVDNNENLYDIHGVKVTPQLSIIDSFTVSLQPGIQNSPCMAHGSDEQILIAYAGWTDEYNNEPFRTKRIWALFNTSGVIQESPQKKPISNPNISISPNPFSGNVKIISSVQEVFGNPAMSIYDISGRLVRNLTIDAPAGNKNISVIWDGKNNKGNPLPAGIYFLRFQSGDFETIKKLIKLR